MSRTTRTPEQTAAIESWRIRYETDHTVTYRQIGADAGVSEHLARSYANSAGWCRSPEVHAATLALASRRGNEARWAGRLTGMSRSSLLRQQRQAQAKRPASAPASVWQFAVGLATTTARHGGRHIEVSA
jgi:hypothetical protein